MKNFVSDDNKVSRISIAVAFTLFMLAAVLLERHVLLNLFTQIL